MQIGGGMIFFIFRPASIFLYLIGKKRTVHEKMESFIVDTYPLTYVLL